MRARFTSAEFDPVLGLFSAISERRAANDNFGGSIFPQLSVTVPVDGMLHFAVSGFADFDFIGEHGHFGDYSLAIEAVPLPAAWLLFAPAFAVLARLRKH